MSFLADTICCVKLLIREIARLPPVATRRRPARAVGTFDFVSGPAQPSPTKPS
ncbi:hypothetical protein DB30_04306 [Enhygromyxa salina]|uniref:Uncharacterized protein n=1 Tax=Enhygromyxa salina TaxID=215803 RepID=A0A0C2D4C4_9BACT|nr:hypothetical protein DB30_04306 [Enhygromyxa salina]